MSRFGALFAAIGLTLIFTLYSEAQDRSESGDSSWVSIEDDPSRMSLFDEMIIPAKRESGENPTDPTIPLAIPKAFYFPLDARTDVILNKPREGSIFGIDISHYTKPNLNHRSLRLQEVRFVYVKATQGVLFKDGLFGAFWDKLHALENDQQVSIGAYHFLTAGDEGKAQAKRFLDFVDLHGGLKPNDMPPCLDLEWDRTKTNPDRWTGVSKEEAVRNAIDWLEYVEAKTGRRPLLYTAKSWLDGRGITGELLARLTTYPVWIADYSPSHKASEKPAVPAGTKPLLWQFASDARLSTGYEGGLDANIYYGTEDEFTKAFGLVR